MCAKQRCEIFRNIDPNVTQCRSVWKLRRFERHHWSWLWQHSIIFESADCTVYMLNYLNCRRSCAPTCWIETMNMRFKSCSSNEREIPRSSSRRMKLHVQLNQLCNHPAHVQVGFADNIIYIYINVDSIYNLIYIIYISLIMFNLEIINVIWSHKNKWRWFQNPRWYSGQSQNVTLLAKWSPQASNIYDSWQRAAPRFSISLISNQMQTASQIKLSI